MSIVVVHKAKLPPNDPLVLAAAKMEGKIRTAFLAAVEAVKDKTVLKDIADAIAAGDAGRVVDLLGIDRSFASALGGGGLKAGVQSVRDALQSTFAAGAKTAMEQLPSKISLAMEFNLLNPEAVRFLERYEFNLIQQITQETREAIRQIVLRAFREGGHPYEQAREIKGIIGLTARMEQSVSNYRSALEGGSTTGLRDALTRALRDGRYDRSLLRALNQQVGLSQDMIDKMVQRYQDRWIQYRARNIARTESLRASNLGQRELWKQARQQGLIPHDAKRRWNISGDERTCQECLDLDGTEVGLDEEFAPGVMDPPDPHPSCRCNTSLVSKSFTKAA